MSRKTLLIIVTLALCCALETAAYHMFADPGPQDAPQRFFSVEQARAYLAQHPDALIIDLRTRQEYAARHNAGTVNIPLFQLHDLASGLPAGRPVLLVDVASARAYQGYWTLRRLRPDIAEIHYVRGWLWADNVKKSLLPKAP